MYHCKCACMALLVCVFCQPVYSLSHPYIIQLDFFFETFFTLLPNRKGKEVVGLDLILDWMHNHLPHFNTINLFVTFDMTEGT